MGWWQRLTGGGREVPAGPLGDLAHAAVVPPDTPLAEVELLAVDLETTGLDPRQDELLSFGFVLVRGGEIMLGTARHLPVRPRGQVGDSAVVHGLTDDALAVAPPLEEALPEVLRAFIGGWPQMQGQGGVDGRTGEPGAAGERDGASRRVLLAHFSQVETTFLAAACREVYGATVGLQVVDTLELARKLLGTPYQQPRAGQVRLDACRRRHGLPRYRAHSAITDALATAELFLAQAAQLEVDRRRPLTLGDVLERGLR